MSDRRRRSEASWNKKEDKSSLRWSNLEVNDDMMPSNHSGRSSWDPLQGNKNRPKADGISRDRHRMQTDPNIDEWGKQYSSRPSHDSYDLSYRSWDRGISDSMSRDRDRPRSPCRSRNMSRSRSRNRDWESERTRSRSPLCDDDGDRDEFNEYPNIRNSYRLSSRPSKDFASRHGGGGSQVDNNNVMDSWSRRPGGSRDDDYHSDNRDNWNRSIYDDQDRRRQSNQISRVVPCRYFSAGKCNRDDCKFSHDSGSLVNKKSRWHDQQAHDDLNTKPNFGEKKKPWNGPSWYDVDSGGFDNIQAHTSEDKSRSWDNKKKLSDGPLWDDVRKSDSSFDNKNRSWNNSSRDDASGYSNASSTRSEKTGRKTKKWNGPLWDELSESGYTDVRKSTGGDMTCSVLPLQMDNKIKKWDGPELEEMAFEKQDHLLPQWTSVTGLQSHYLDVQEQHVMPQALGGRCAKVSTSLTPEVFVASSDLDNADKNSEDANHQIPTSVKDTFNDLNSQSLSYSNGTEQSEHMLPFSRPKFQLNRQVEGTFLHMRQTENKNKEVSEIGVPQFINEFKALPVSLPTMSSKGQLPQLYTELNLSDAIDFLKSLPSSAYNQDTKTIEKVNSSAASMNVKTSVPVMSGSERQENQVFPLILTDGPTSTTENGEICFIENSPKTKKQELIGNPEGSHIRVAESANQEQKIINPDKVEEGVINPSEIGVPKVINEFNALPVSLPAMSPKGQLQESYAELNLSSPIDFLKSLPSSAYNQDTKTTKKVNSAAASMNVKTSVPIMSGLERQENQVFPPILTDGPTSTTENGKTCFMENSPKTKKRELIGNPEGSHIRIAEIANQEQEIINPDKVEEGDITNDEKSMRLFKVALVEFVKEILKPKWKEGNMSRDIHKTVVKKAVEKVTSTIQGIQIPKTQAKIDQYLACSKPKITKLVEAYVERLLKP